MGVDFMLNIDHFLMIIAPNNMSANELLKHLKQIRDTKFQVCLVICSINFPENEKKQLINFAKDINNWFVVPDTRELNALLLKEPVEKIFAHIITRQVKVTRVSPYQTEKGIKKDSVFFGREQLLAHIIQREPANYFLIGGRQLGKTSLLKALNRRYSNDSETICYYLSLSGTDILTPIAIAMDIDKNSSIKEIANVIRQHKENSRLIFLVDEADTFIQAQAEKKYPILREFRSLSEEGRCYFIMAGFWYLYHSAALDYQSPLKNFAETLFIGALEPHACKALATIPMHLMNINYDPHNLVEKIIYETGRRANLIAIICNSLLQIIDMNKRKITSKEINKVLDGNEIRKSLAGWGNLCEDEKDNHFDRIVVYATIDKISFNTEDIVTILKKYQFPFNAQKLQQSLLRLELSFILKRDHGNYSYCVPLFKRIILESNPKLMLESELELY